MNVKIVVPHNQGKRYKKKIRKINKKKVFGVICLIIILISIVSYNLRKGNNPEVQTEENIINTVEEDNDYQENEELKQEPELQTNETIESNLPDKMGNYKVIGELVIEKIGVRNNILDKTDNNSLNLSVTKFYGVDINHVGNICITGHNYTKMLKRLNELNVGDRFYMINKDENTKVEYEVFDMYTCNPNNLECLDSRTNNEKEVTLITCNPGGITRLICKAKEI